MTARPGTGGDGTGGPGGPGGGPARGASSGPGSPVFRPGAGGPPGGPGGPGPGGRPAGPGGGRGPGMMGLGMGMPPAKSKDFRGSLRRLFGTLGPERPLIVGVVLLAIISVFFSVIGPKIMGNAINTIFEGALGKQLSNAGVTQEQAIAGARAQGNEQLANLLSGLHLNPAGIDFSALGGVLLFLVGVYILSSIFSWMQGWIMSGVTNRTVLKLRTDVDEKLGRLPLRYFDSHPRGDLLSRVTNDIDNIGQSLQQSLTQLITALLTIIGVLALMIWISPLLAVISLLTVPLSIVVTVFIAKR